MDPGEGLISPPGAPQAAVNPVQIELNGPRVVPSADLTAAAFPKDENDQGNIGKPTNATATNGLASAAFTFSPKQILKAPAGVTAAPMPHPESSMKAVTILNGANNDISSPRPLQPVTDITNNISVEAQTLISPPAAFTPGAHATPANPVMDQLASPVRPAGNRVTPLPSPIPPPSVGKQEVNDAAMALTWLAEALTGPAAVSPFGAVKPEDPSPAYPTTTTDRRRKVANTATPFAASTGLQNNNNNTALYTTPYAAGLAGAPPHTTSGSLRGRRAASQRCSTVVQETILNDRLLNCNPRSLQEGYEYTPRNTTTTPATKRLSGGRNEAAQAASAERKLRGYSENSRVGRAMVSILQYITVHQPEYNDISPGGGVPERIIRQEFGNNPDTSKALRFLVSEKKIVRKGLGGRKDPFNYVLSNSHASRAAAAAAADSMAGETAVAIAVAAAAVAAGDGAGAYSSPPFTTEEMERQAKSAAGISAVAPATVFGPPSLTPAAAAATLTAPSTGKWPTTEPRFAVDPTLKGRKPSQPRLSLGMADPISLDEGRAAAERDAVAKQGLKRPAPTSLPSGNASSKPKTVSFQGQQQQQWTGPWPTQLPSGQRLTSLASPLPLSTTPPHAAAPATLGAVNPIFLVPAAPGTASTGTMPSASQQQQQQQAVQAYLLQMKAAQILWNQQVYAFQRAHHQQQMTAAANAGANAAAAARTTTTLVSPEQQLLLGVNNTTAAPVPSAAPATAAAGNHA